MAVAIADNTNKVKIVLELNFWVYDSEAKNNVEIVAKGISTI